jgi:hypothetical protein
LNEYVALFGGTFIVCIVVMVLFFLFTWMKNKNKSNVIVAVVESFRGNKAALICNGNMEFMDELGKTVLFIRKEKKKINAGAIKSKYFYLSAKGKHFIALDEFEKGRFRPIVITDKLLQESTDGNLTEAIEAASVFNDDIEYTLATKEKYNDMIKANAKKAGFWSKIAGGILAVIFVITMVIASYMNWEAANASKAGAKMIAESQTTAIKTAEEVFFRLLTNATVRDIVKPTDDRTIPKPSGG